ncbi:MAG: NosD domain-containing protein [Thermoplasmata archaeon]
MLTARMRRIVWVLVAEVLLASLGAFFASPRVAQASDDQDFHAPIFIEGNDDFTASNGVVGGSGTPSDPYAITELRINASGAHGIRIENTNATFLIREVVIESGGLFHDGISLRNVTDGRVESSNVSNSRNGIHVVNSGNINLYANDLGSNLGHGIHLLSTTGAVVLNNNVTHNQDVGIWVQSSTDVTVTGNFVSSIRRFDNSVSWRDTGIYLQFSAHVAVSNNVVESFESEGIDVGASRDVNVVGNAVRSNGRSVTSSYSHNVTIAENAITDNSRGILVSNSTGVRIRGNNVSKNGWDGISLSSSPGAIVRHNVLSSWIQVHSPFVLVENNTLRSNGAGIYLFSTTNATLRGNHLTSNGLTFWGREMVHLSSHDIDVSNLVNGAPLRYHRDCSGLTVDGVLVGQLVVANCTDVRISNLQITDTETAIKLAYVDGARLENSVIYANRGLGIELERVRNTTIVGNTVVLNEEGGIGLLSSSQITIVGNNVTYNGVPIFGQAGVGLKFTSDTLIYRNNIINNSKQAEVVVGRGDAWDNGYSSGGNFWSDYSGEDRCSGPEQDVCPDPDGLGDTPYEVDFSGVDNYPLMAASGPPNTPPLAALEVSPPVGGPTTGFVLDASGSVDAEDLPGMLTYRWDWEGDGTWDGRFSTRAVVRHQYAIPGNHTIRLEARDSRGATNITEGEVTVLNAPPIPRIRVHREIGDTSTTFRFDANASFDHSDPTISLRVRWDWQNDGIWDTPLTVNKFAAHRYDHPGMHTVRLEARDTGDLAGEATSNILVLPDQPPVASFWVSPSIGDNTTIFSVDASDSFDWGNLSAPLQFRWDWEGDGLWDTLWTFEDDARHRFQIPGTYGMRLEVMDPAGLTNHTVRTVSVVDTAAPLIQHVAPDRVQVGQPISITVQVTDSSANLNVSLRYRGVTDLAFTLLEMGRIQDGSFHAWIPPQAETGFLRYNFAAVDESLNGRISPTFTVYVTAQLSPSSMGTIALAGAGAVILAYWLIRRTRPPSGSAERKRR